jgi:uncharacterized coiled-coil DUF342 family protein
MKFTEETIITAEMLKTEEVRNLRDALDNWADGLMGMILDIKTIKNSMVGKSVAEIENEIDEIEEKFERLYHQVF